MEVNCFQILLIDVIFYFFNMFFNMFETFHLTFAVALVCFENNNTSVFDSDGIGGFCALNYWAGVLHVFEL